MKTKNIICRIGTAFCLAVLMACSNNTSSDDVVYSVDDLEGVVEKGPFVKGTTVTLYELNPETFAQTGKVFTGTIDNDDGAFSLGKVELESPYVLLDATGYYWNEISGKNSSKMLSLKSIALVDENKKINVNVGTHITYQKVLGLLDAGMEFEKAKSQAETELMKAIFGEDSGIAFETASVRDNEILLAVSIMMLMNGSESDITEMMGRLASDITPELLVKWADNVALKYSSYSLARINMEKRFPNTTIGPFEGYIYGFWQRVYGLEACSETTSGMLDTIRAENSIYDGKILACKEYEAGSGVYLWNEATDVDISTAGLEPVENGKLVKSVADSTKLYVFEGSAWREATDSESKVGMGCFSALKGTIVESDDVQYVCKKVDKSFIWKQASIRDLPKDSYFNEKVKYGSVKDKRDGRVYKTVEIAGKTWLAENLAYVIDKCTDSLTVGCDYSWNIAMSFAKEDSVIEDNHGICMDGWHIPDSTEWNTLVEAYDLEDLLSETGWSSGKNGSGFSIVPIGYSSGAGYVSAYVETGYADFVVANCGVGTRIGGSPNGTRVVYGYAVSFDKNRAEITEMTQKDKGSSRYLTAAVRCVKD